MTPKHSHTRITITSTLVGVRRTFCFAWWSLMSIGLALNLRFVQYDPCLIKHNNKVQESVSISTITLQVSLGGVMKYPSLRFRKILGNPPRYNFPYSQVILECAAQSYAMILSLGLTHISYDVISLERRGNSSALGHRWHYRTEREKFYPGPGLQPEPLTFRTNTLTN